MEGIILTLVMLLGGLWIIVLIAILLRGGKDGKSETKGCKVSKKHRRSRNKNERWKNERI